MRKRMKRKIYMRGQEKEEDNRSGGLLSLHEVQQEQ